LLLTVGAGVARLAAAPDGSALPKATASRACAYEDIPVGDAPARELRSAALCLINRARRRWHLPALREQRNLNRAAQGHTNQMVADGIFSHLSIRGAEPWTRIGRTGFRWSAVGETISTGYATPLQTVRGWLGSTEHCRILLSPLYREIGIGVDRGWVRGYATIPGTWTADLALPAGRRPPSGNWAPASGCPH
jgi:uncharacterized protein YkwD